MARITVTEPVTGVEVEVEADSPQAVAWGKPRKADKPKAPTKAEMLAEIERRNDGREDDAKIVPASQNNDDLAAALKADDEAAAQSE